MNRKCVRRSNYNRQRSRMYILFNQAPVTAFRSQAKKTDETKPSSESDVVYRSTPGSNGGSNEEINRNSSHTTADDSRNYSKVDGNMNQIRIHMNDQPKHLNEGETNASFRADSQTDCHLYHSIVPGVSSDIRVNNESDYVLPETLLNNMSKQSDTGYRHDDSVKGNLRWLQGSKPKPVVEYENLKGAEMMPENAYESTTAGTPAASDSMPALSQHQLYSPTYEDIPKFKPNLESPYLVANVKRTNV